MPQETVSIETLVWMLVIGAGVAMVVRYIRLPYTIALVLAGLTVGSAGLLPRIELTKELVFTIFLPPLLFEATLNVSIDMLRRNAVIITVLAVLGVVLAAGLVAVGGVVWLGFPVLVAALFGVLIAPTDPVSVLAVLRDLHVPRRLAVILEGESLFNDGTAAVLFGILVAIARTSGEVAAAPILTDFVIEVAGGALVGLMVGLAVRVFMTQVDDHLIEITLTTIAAYGSYLLAAHLVHVSGVIATIVAGITLGTVRSQRVMSSTTRLAVYTFWEYYAFLINSVVFLLIGIDIHLGSLLQHAPKIGMAYAAVVLARAASIYVIGMLFRRPEAAIPWSWRNMLVWGGMRGSLSMALALALSGPLTQAGLHDRYGEVRTVTFGVVLLSLLVQGLTLGPVVRALGLSAKRGVDLESTYLVKLRAMEAAGEELNSLRERKRIAPPVADRLQQIHATQMAEIEAKLQEMYDASQEGVGREQEKAALARMRATQRDVIRRAEKEGAISRDAAHTLLRELADTEEA